MSVPMAIIDENIIHELVEALIHSGDTNATCGLEVSSAYPDRFSLTLTAVVSKEFRDRFLARMSVESSATLESEAAK